MLAPVGNVGVDGEAHEHLCGSEGREQSDRCTDRPMHDADASAALFGSRYRFEKMLLREEAGGSACAPAGRPFSCGPAG